MIEAALALTRDWCRIPSTAGNDTALATQAGAVADWLRHTLGAEIIPTRDPKGRPPVVHARLDAGAAHTVILYNMYDVMPADPAGWVVDPFTGGTAVLDGIGACFVARGAENNKGPLAGMLCAVQALSGALPVNIEILVEGQEETGSGALRDYLADADCPVRPSMAALFPSFCEYGGGAPRLYLGGSGIAKGEVVVAGGAWGGPTVGIHSSNAPWIANPARRLIEVLARFGTDPVGALDRIALDDEACAVIDALAFDPAAELRFRRTERYAQDEPPGERLRRVLSTVSVNVSGLSTDPPGADAVIPASARATFDLRCPPPLDPADYLDRLRGLLLPGAALRVADSYPGFRFPAGSPAVAALVAAYGATSVPPQVWPWAIGAAPGYAFLRHAPCFLLGGAGRGGHAHGVNEFLTLEGFARYIASIRLWLEGLA